MYIRVKMLYSINLLVKTLAFYVYPCENVVFYESPRERKRWVFMYLWVKMLYSTNLLVKMVVFYVSPGKNAVFGESPH